MPRADRFDGAATHRPAQRRRARGRRFEASVFAQARALQHWRSAIATAASAAAPSRSRRAGWLGHCTQCGAEHYPRTDPAVIVAVSDGERLLLGRQAQLAGAALFGDRRFRRAGRIAGADRRARSARGNRRARAQLPLPGLAAVAVPRRVDAGLRRRCRTRRAAGGRRAGGRALVHASTKCARRGARRGAMASDDGVGPAVVAAHLDRALADRAVVCRPTDAHASR